MKQNKKESSFFDRLRQSFSSSSKINKERDRSVEWLKAKLQNFAPYSKKSTPEELTKTTRGKKTAVGSLGNEPTIGSMFMFSYRAKYADTLPFWDAFPVIVLLGPAKNGFLGLNTHYLPLALRAKFFDGLLDTLTTKKVVTAESRMIITYDYLKNSSKLSFFKPCLKHYLGSNVNSRIIKINPEEWLRVLFLESAQWQNAGKSTVYKWSRSQI